jgi:hypothetical protein
MRTIHITNEADLIPLPGRSVSAWESGVVRVEEKYVGLTSMESIHRPLFAVGNPPPSGDNTPSFDGLTISSLPNESRRADGFTEYTITLHGRVDNTGTGDPTSSAALVSQSSLILNTLALGPSFQSENPSTVNVAAFTPRVRAAVINRDVGGAFDVPENWDFAIQPFNPDDLGTRLVVRRYRGGSIRGLAGEIRYTLESGVDSTIAFIRADLNVWGTFLFSMRPEGDFSKNGGVDELTVNWFVAFPFFIFPVGNFPSRIFDINGNLVERQEDMFPPMFP